MDSYVVIWTTTPWTIPANLAISVHPDFTYTLARLGDDHLVVAEECSLLSRIYGAKNW
jgi:isoleucyl-tRNA synthetase